VLVFTASGIPMIFRDRSSTRSVVSRPESHRLGETTDLQRHPRALSSSFACGVTGTTRRAGFAEVTWRSTMSTTATTSAR
jgi:hypothetical protein